MKKIRMCLAASFLVSVPACANSTDKALVDNEASPGDPLVAHYGFDGNANDSSTNQNHAELHGPTLTTDRFLNPNRAYQFDGVDDFIRIPASSVLDFEFGDFSFSFWLRYGSQAGGTHDYAAIFIKSTQFTGPYQGPTLFVDKPSSGGLLFRVTKNHHLYSNVSDTNDNLWHHFVCIRQNNTIKVFIDGVLNAAAKIPAVNASNTAPLVVGANHQRQTSQNYEGAMDDLRIYSRALSADEIRQLYGVANQ